MIKKISNNSAQEIIEYIGKDYGKCLYLYIDLKKYGCNRPFFTVWVQKNNEGEITAILSKYYNGMQIFSRNNQFNENEIAKIIKEHHPNVIVGMKETVDCISSFFSDYKNECGIVGELKELTIEPFKSAYCANSDEIEEIVRMVSEDDALGKPYGYELLLEQYRQRNQEGSGRNFILRDNNNKIICHAATYAELPELAVISGVITAPQYRGKGYSKGTLAAICKQLLFEKKKVFSYYYITAATKMHEGIGFNKIGEWKKLVESII